MFLFLPCFLIFTRLRLGLGLDHLLVVSQIDPKDPIYVFFLKLLLNLFDFALLLDVVDRNTFERLSDNFANPNHILLSPLPVTVDKGTFTGTVADAHLLVIYFVGFNESHDHVNRDLSLALFFVCGDTPIEKRALRYASVGNFDYLGQKLGLASGSHFLLPDRQT